MKALNWIAKSAAGAIVSLYSQILRTPLLSLLSQNIMPFGFSTAEILPIIPVGTP